MKNNLLVNIIHNIFHLQRVNANAQAGAVEHFNGVLGYL
jgi:hypothetical protein